MNRHEKYIVATAQRVVLRMRARKLHQSGMTLMEIAAVLHQPESTIRNILK